MSPEEWRRLPREEKNRLRREKHERRRAERAAGSSQRFVPSANPIAWKHCKSGKFFSRDLSTLNLSTLYQGSSCFLVSCGPSLLQTDLSQLNRRGVLTCGINNSPTVFRTNLWVFGDPPYKFHDAIWKDPAITKFVPLSFLSTNPIREKTANGFEWLGRPGHLYPQDMPNVIGYRRSGRLDAETFLTEDSISFGRSEKHAKREKLPHINNTFFSVIKVLYSIGVRTIYLLGCDFKMSPMQPYAFGQQKSDGGVRSNNRSYARMNDWFVSARPTFEAAGLRIFNCTPESGLTAFERVDYLDAVTACTGHVPQDPLDARGWYQL